MRGRRCHGGLRGRLSLRDDGGRRRPDVCRGGGGRVGLVRGRRCGSGSRRGRSRRQQRERVEVPLGLVGAPDAEVHVRLRKLALARRTDAADDIALCNTHPVGDRDRAEMRQRDGIAVGGGDGHALAGGRDGPGERDRPGRRRDDRCVRGGADVDSSVLPGGVRMRRIEDERLEHRPVGGPGPGPRDRCEMKRSGDRREQCSAHGLPLELGLLDVPGVGTCVLLPR
jgi:hypothetical protein